MRRGRFPIPSVFEGATGPGRVRTAGVWLIATISGGLQFFVVGAKAQSLDQARTEVGAMLNFAPVAIALGALLFGIFAALWIKRAKSKKSSRFGHDQTQIAQLRAQLDKYEALLATMPEVTLLWADGDSEPTLFGDATNLRLKRTDISSVLDFPDWIVGPDFGELGTRLTKLRLEGEAFELDLHTFDNRVIRAAGRALGNTTALRLRVGQSLSDNLNETGRPSQHLDAENNPETTEPFEAKSILSALPHPAWIRNGKAKLTFANIPYLDLAEKLGRPNKEGGIAELFTPGQIVDQLAAISLNKDAVKIAPELSETEEFDLHLKPVSAGSVGYLCPRPQHDISLEQIAPHSLERIMDASPTPMAIFDARGKLTQFNSAYIDLWGLEDNWLTPGMDERSIMDRLRTEGLLPVTIDYREWRDQHLEVYRQDKPRQSDWHLTDGRTITVTATPAAGIGGVIYVFNDVTEKLKLKSTNKSLINVQRETLNALSEAVAVFGTDGRLRLHNPRLSTIWKLPMNKLGKRPHIDIIAKECGRTIVKDGESIWADLKLSVVNLDPNRVDKNGRYDRSDGRLIDYAIVRLPDGQTMLTFVDVTHSANYERVLTERNQALIAADQLKDAFVQNVSYELRSPLTNIMGFADLLASDSVGKLNEQQRQYTDYIRGSSTTLGILIDNILDLTNVDAGVAELDLAPVNIAAAIEKAKTGIAATFSGADGAKPLNLIVDLPQDLPEFVADGGRIVQIIYNLLSNAANFSEPGAEISLSVELREDWMHFVVEDDGMRSPDKTSDVNSTLSKGRTISGREREVGLGLTIVRAFVQLHGGTVSMEKKTPSGMRVAVNLPLVASQVILSPQNADA